MVSRLILAISFMAVCSAASAEAPKSKGAYIGGSFGSSTFEDDGAFLGFGVDDSDTAYQAYAGYKFSRYFGLEARFASLGSYSDGIDSLDVSAYSLHVVGIIPFGTSGWELFGQIGLGTVNQEVAGIVDEDDRAGAAGMGIRWHINQSIAVAAQVDAYAWEADVTGTLYDWGVATNQLSFQVNF